MSEKTAVVIGSGVGGLAIAARLASRGINVAVYDTAPSPGGKARTLVRDGFTFDKGPSLFTMPQYLDDVFIAAGRDPRDYYSYNQCDESCRYFWPDGLRFSAPANAEEFVRAASEAFRVEREVVMSYMEHIEHIYNKCAKIFLERPLHLANTWLNAEALKAAAQIHRYDLFKSMHRANKIRLGEEHLVQLFDRYATYNGSDPYRARGILNVIPWFEIGYGTYFPVGGMRTIPNALYRLCTDLGVEFHFNTRVKNIELEKKRATGVVANRFHRADMVISAADVKNTYRYLLKDKPVPKALSQAEPSSSAIVFYWGVKGQRSEFGLHNILFSKNYLEEFEAILRI